MPSAALRHSTLAWLSLSGVAYAQLDDVSSRVAPASAGEIYEQSRQDVTLPLANPTQDGASDLGGIAIPIEHLATPMRCMTAWSYLAGRIIQSETGLDDLHADFTEASASAHWQHWLKLDLDAHNGALSPDFHQRRLAAERAFSLNLAEQEEIYAYRTLGTCYVAPSEREIADPTLLLRNFMVDHQGLPASYAVPVLQRQLRTFPIDDVIELETDPNCDSGADQLQTEARLNAILACFERGGVLASRPKAQIEDLGSICRATGSVQCENIP
ncbi:MAG: hypothetical protein AAFO74_11220 [Pseudomonadota bacterium]